MTDDPKFPSEELIKLPTDKLLQKFGKGSHKPGSGSAAALIGLLSCKLLQTVISLTTRREAYKEKQPQLTLANQDIVGAIEPYLTQAIQQDAIQFGRVIKARTARDKEPPDSKKRKALAEEALAELRKATEIPIEIAEKCLLLARTAMTVFDLGFKAARGDSGVAISSALAAASGAIAIVYLNLTSFKGSEWAVHTRKRADSLAEQIQKLQAELFSRIVKLQEEVVNNEGRNS